MNSLLPENNKIKFLSFKNSEHLGQTDADRKSLFDIYCEAENSEKFIVELQKAKQNFFKERTVYYSTFPKYFSSISLLPPGKVPKADEAEQAEKGEWNYNLTPVFCIGILDFTFDDYENEREKSEVVHTIKLKNQNGKTFYDKLTYIYLEMPNFTKLENELVTRLDNWLFFIQHLEDFESIPAIFRNEAIFNQAFEKAELARFDNAEWESYESSLKEYRDIKGYIDTAFGDGKAQRTMEIAKAAKMMGLSAHGRVDRLKGLGNAIVPQVAFEIFKGLESVHRHGA